VNEPDPTSLARLHDIVLPPPLPWWPPAPGWLWLLGIVAVVALVLLLRGFIRWQRNRYRREALVELARLVAAGRNEAGPGDALLGLSELLKRTALTAFPRERVAALSGAEWFAFLVATGGTRFAQGPGAMFEAALYGAGETGLDDKGFLELAALARAWIRQHRPC
jgi:hypothetical protein